MRFYLLLRKEEAGHDEACGFVVAARNPAEARHLAGQNAGDEGYDAWLNAQFTSYEALRPGKCSRLILRDFKNG